jgi:electron transfer flavoprotein beta subunit
MGPPQADLALREALAMGCDEAYLLTAREFGGSDTFATAKIISSALEKIGYDLIITGRQAIDGDTAQVGPQIAENLNIPQVSYAEAVTVKGDVVTVKRQYEDRYHMIEVKTPCLITALQELGEPRYMHARGIIEAYEKEIKIMGFDDLKDKFNPTEIGIEGSPTNVFKSFGKMAKGAGTIHKDLSPDEAVEVIMKKMKERHII